MKVRLIEPVLEEGSCCWLLELAGLLVGVNYKTGWCVRVEERVIPLDAESKFMPLSPLLEVPEADFSAFLKRAAAAVPACSELVQAFPKQALLKHIFHSSYSSYWPERALDWLAADQELWSNFREELKVFSTNKEMPQRARQIAQRMLRSINCD